MWNCVTIRVGRILQSEPGRGRRAPILVKLFSVKFDENMDELYIRIIMRGDETLTDCQLTKY